MKTKKALALAFALNLFSFSSLSQDYDESSDVSHDEVPIVEEIHIKIPKDYMTQSDVNSSVPKVLTKEQVDRIVETSVIEELREICREHNERALEQGYTPCPDFDKCMVTGEFIYKGARIDLELSIGATDWVVDTVKVLVDWAPSSKQSLAHCYKPRFFPIVARVKKGLHNLPGRPLKKLSKSDIGKLKKNIQENIKKKEKEDSRDSLLDLLRSKQ